MKLLLLQSRQSGINMVMVTHTQCRTMHTNTSSLVSSHTRVQLKQSFNAKYKVVRDLVRIECPLSGREPCQVPRIFMSLKYFYLIELSSLQRYKKWLSIPTMHLKMGLWFVNISLSQKIFLPPIHCIRWRYHEFAKPPWCRAAACVQVNESNL